MRNERKRQRPTRGCLWSNSTTSNQQRKQLTQTTLLAHFNLDRDYKAPIVPQRHLVITGSCYMFLEYSQFRLARIDKYQCVND